MNPQDAIFAALSFFIMPPLVSFLSGKNAPGAVKSLILVVLSLISGVAITLLTGSFTAEGLAKNILVVIGSAVTSYKFLLKDFSDAFLGIGPQIGDQEVDETLPEPVPVVVVERIS